MNHNYLEEFERIARDQSARLDRRDSEHEELSGMLRRLEQMTEESGGQDFGLISATSGLHTAIFARCPHDPETYAVEPTRRWECHGIRHTSVDVTCPACGVWVCREGDDWGFPSMPVHQANAAD